MASIFERFSPPLLNTNMVGRQAIIKQINDLSSRGILFIHAPAGYGKTTAVALWSQNKNTAWLSLDEYSKSSVDIYKWLLFALSCEIPELFANAPLKCTLDALQKAEEWPKAIIIDDYHLCSDSSVARALPLIRARMPVSTSFIIISRTPPSDALYEQIAKDKVKQITGLQFTNDEIMLLFEKNNKPISKYDAEILCKQTGGWAAGLMAVLMSRTGHFSDMLDRKTLNHYLKSYVFDYWDDFDILKKCSACDELNPKVCEAITGREGAWDVIVSLAGKTGLVCKVDNNTYRFHDLLKEFLFSELQLDETIDKPLLYKTLANWYKDNGDLLRASVLAAKSEDICLLEDYLWLRASDYGKYHVNVVDCATEIIENIYTKVPDSVAKQSLRLSLDYFSSLFFLGRLQEAFEWIDTAKKLLAARKNTLSDVIGTAFHRLLDPREKVWDIPAFFNNSIYLTAEQTVTKTVLVITATANMPFFHKAQVDYAEISPRLDEYLPKFWSDVVLPYTGSISKPILLIFEAGLRYERGELARAEKIAAEAAQISGHFPPEVQFCSLMLYAEILRIQGKAFDLARIDSMIHETKTHYLAANFDAYTANIQLQNGEVTAADAWLARAEVESTLRFFKVYQYFTTARALIVTRKLSEAENLLERLAVFSQDYRRSSDFIKALTLQAICKWQMKRTDDAVKTFIPAIIKATELQLIMPIAIEGHDVLPVLQKVLNRLKCGYDADILDKAFVNTLFFKARTIAQYSRGMFAENKVKPVKLSPRQIEILEYLCQNLSYREISNKTGIKIATVDYHIRKIYEKLGVSNARDAITKASELGIGNTA